MNKKKNFKKPLKLTCFLISFMTLAISLYFSSNSILVNFGEKSFLSLISSASYFAIDQIIETGYDYKSLTSITTDKDGMINMVVTDSLKVNSIAAKTANKTYEYLDRESKKGVDIPLGAFSGIRLLSGFGKPIRMKLISVVSVKCDIVSEFKQAGINQTRHSLYFNITSSVSIVTKTSTKTVVDKITVLVYDNLIVGKVPSVFINSTVIGQGSEK